MHVYFNLKTSWAVKDINRKSVAAWTYRKTGDIFFRDLDTIRNKQNELSRTSDHPVRFPLWQMGFSDRITTRLDVFHHQIK